MRLGRRRVVNWRKMMKKRVKERIKVVYSIDGRTGE